MYVQQLLPGGPAHKSRSVAVGSPAWLVCSSSYTAVSRTATICRSSRHLMMFTMAGDILLQVDGVDVTRKPASNICMMLLGEPGTSVKLILQRPALPSGISTPGYRLLDAQHRSCFYRDCFLIFTPGSSLTRTHVPPFVPILHCAPLLLCCHTQEDTSCTT